MPVAMPRARRTTSSTTATVLTVLRMAIIARDTRAPGALVLVRTPHGESAQDTRTPSGHPLQCGEGIRASHPLVPYEPPRPGWQRGKCQDLPPTILHICTVYKHNVAPWSCTSWRRVIPPRPASRGHQRSALCAVWHCGDGREPVRASCLVVRE